LEVAKSGLDVLIGEA